MRFLKIFFLSILAWATGCSGGLKERVPPDKMSLILADISTAEAYVDIAKEAQKDSLTHIYYDQIFARYGVNKADFDSTMIFLARNPNAMETVQHKALENLENIKKKDSAVLKR